MFGTRMFVNDTVVCAPAASCATVFVCVDSALARRQ